MEKISREKKIIVLGLGNILNRDEGAGVYALKELEKIIPESCKREIDLIDGGVLGLDLLPYVEQATHLLILDVTDFKGEAGEIKEFPTEEIPTFFTGKISWHQLGFQEVLEVARVRGHFPEKIHLIGIQPGDLNPGIGLSPGLNLRLREAARRAAKILESWMFHE